MNNNKKELELINGRLIGLLLFIICLTITYLIVYNEKLNIENKQILFTNKESLNISLIIRIIYVILGIYFVYNAVESKKLNNDDSNLQIIASLLALSASLVILYIVWDNYNKLNQI